MFKLDALTNSQYIYISAIHDMHECEAMLCVDGVRSNRSIDDFMTVLQYEDTRKYDGSREKIYAILLVIQVPRFASLDEQKEFVTKFMSSFIINDYAPYEEDIPYVYWQSHQGEGDYMNILLCQRAFYKTPKTQPVVWKKNTWIDKVTGRFCSKDNPNAVLKERGTIKHDKDGNVMYETYFISPIKDRSFNYYSDGDTDVKKSKFKYFMTSLKQKAQKVINSMCEVNTYLQGIAFDFKNEQFNRFSDKEWKGKVLHYNACLKTIKFGLGLCCHQINASKKAMENLGGSYDLKAIHYTKYNEFKALVRKISDIFKNKKLSYKTNTKLKKEKNVKTIDFALDQQDLSLRVWKKKFNHAYKIIEGMIEKYQKKYLDDEYVPFDLMYQEGYRQAKMEFNKA